MKITRHYDGLHNATVGRVIVINPTVVSSFVGDGNKCSRLTPLLPITHYEFGLHGSLPSQSR
ncbi:MAG: hypothetical protein ACUVSC_13370, partial [Candidatus Fervidibacter sp.]|uniref:hypothetical protein n=1 Tax=Candidatus Fervidibacter sp. TaxID=3100871 RepID=UPI0040497C5C